jgi:cytochrome c biogenesis protein ResB
MRTAILFLIGLVLIVSIGAVVPQEQTSDPSQVQQFLSNNAHLDALATNLGLPLTHVYVSLDFYILLASLFIALGACVLGRGRALVRRTVRGYPRTAQYWGEWFSWLFHSSFFLLLVAVLYGKATGFQGLLVIVEGQTITNAPSSYEQLQDGLLFSGKYSDFQLRLDKFDVSYQSDGQASTYDSKVTVIRHGRPMLTKNVEVNDYLNYAGIHFYQEDYGWAPMVEVRNPAGQVVFDAPVLSYGSNYSVQTGVLKVPDFNYTPPGAGRPLQLGANTLFMPDALDVPAIGANGSLSGLTVQPGGLTADNPVLQLQLFAGDLGLNSGLPQNVNTLDTSRMAPLLNGAPLDITVGQSAQVALSTTSGKTVTFTVSVPALHQYTVLLANYDNGVPLVYAGFVLILVGITGKLYLRPLLERRERGRRARAEPPAGATSDHVPPVVSALAADPSPPHDVGPRSGDLDTLDPPARVDAPRARAEPSTRDRSPLSRRVRERSGSPAGRR